MSHKELVEDARRFVEQTFTQGGGRMPTKKAMTSAAEKIVRALRPTMLSDKAPSTRRKAR